MTKEENKSAPVLSDNLFPVVGVGASAGGLEAFKEFVKAIPEDSGMAYIFIQHLAPQVESILSDILQKNTTLPVLEITDNLKVVPDHIYIIPSNKLLTASDGVLHLEPRIKGEKLNTINKFFNSLADIHQEHSIGIVLSGTGGDGTMGLKTIRDIGGITMVQDQNSAAYYGMPQSAIDAGVVDFVLSPKEMPRYLQELVTTANLNHSKSSDSEEFKDDDVYRQIIGLLRVKRGVDFTYYKQTTIRRRILRRKVLNKIGKLKDYQNLLLENKSEQDALFKDLLIPVTSFFRDPNIFTVLSEKILPLIIKEKTASEPVRIWVAGCSTGEEAYSMAICLHEYLGDKTAYRKVQIFGTDISESAIEKARSGIFQRKDMGGISEDRINQYFTKINGSYQANKVIREMCVFALQNFLKDPPFARIDVISCRNVLIYMEPYLQKKALTTFHYSLNKDGFLLLGKSETVGQQFEKFILFSQHDKIYTKLANAGKFMAVASERSENTLKINDDILKTRGGKQDDFQKSADEALLSKYSTVGVIVNEQLDILQFRGSTSSFLESPPGKASHNILNMAKEGLSFELRNALHKSKINNEAIKKENILFDKGKKKVTIEVIPLQNTIELYFLVLFNEDIPILNLKTKKAKIKLNKEEEAKVSLEIVRIEQLEKELAQVKEDMHGITEDQEASNEELQSANEELLSGSEELQSLNEELETTKEEIQSSNEELTILNQELIERNEQLIQSRKYTEAVISTIHEPFIILTSDFQIKSANKSFYDKFEIAEEKTAGKNFLEFEEGMWDLPGLHEKLKNILPYQSYFENYEVCLNSSSLRPKTMLLNAKQLINTNNNEQLILLAIQDITDQKIFEQELELQVVTRTRELKEANLNHQHSNENLQQFASIASHDLQEPLRKIKTFTSILNRRFGKEVPEEGKDIIGKIKLSVDRMSQLIKEVLEYSKVVHHSIEFQETSLDEILRNVIEDLDLLIADTGGIINYKTPLPVIDAIPIEMNQLFYNILTNALKFYKETVSPEITISIRRLSHEEIIQNENLKENLSYIEIKFSDNGIGFEQQFADQIFQIFERLHSIEEFEGTGIGLALCKKIVENHNGQIYALSKENEGSTFYILLPLKQ
ncbi:MAG: hypothetical protein NVS9B7_18710 [Flavisolibacter sp.]